MGFCVRLLLFWETSFFVMRERCGGRVAAMLQGKNRKALG